MKSKRIQNPAARLGLSAALVTALGLVFMLGCRTSDPEQAPTASEPAAAGIYDSRAVALAYSRSGYFQTWMEALQQGRAEAEAAGDSTRTEALGMEAQARQELLHRQVFSTGSVDELLALVQDRIPAIRTAAGVEQLISRWDQEALAPYAKDRQIDVTMELVKAFDPSAEGLRLAEEVLDVPPVSPEDLQRHLEGKHE